MMMSWAKRTTHVLKEQKQLQTVSLEAEGGDVTLMKIYAWIDEKDNLVEKGAEGISKIY